MRCDRRTVAQNEHTRTQANKHQNESSNERITEKKEKEPKETRQKQTRLRKKKNSEQTKRRQGVGIHYCVHGKMNSSCLWMIRWLSMTTNSVV